MATLVYHVETLIIPLGSWIATQIPSPGSYSHFHWSDTADHPSPGKRTHDGYLLQLDAADTFCFVHSDSANFDSRLTCETTTRMMASSCDPGIDIATHLNIVGSYPGSVAP